MTTTLRHITRRTQLSKTSSTGKGRSTALKGRLSIFVRGSTSYLDSWRQLKRTQDGDVEMARSPLASTTDKLTLIASSLRKRTPKVANSDDF